MSIRRIAIENFKNIESIDIELERINIFVGPNNSGKSSVLQAVQFSVSALQGISLHEGDKWKRDGSLSSTLSANQLMYSPVHDPYDLGHKSSFTQKKGMTCLFEMEDGERCEIYIKKGKNKNLAITANGSILGKKISDLDSFFCAMAPGLAGIASLEEYKTPGLVRKAAARGDSNHFLRNILFQLRIKEAEDGDVGWDEFNQWLAEIFPGIEIDVNFDEDNDDHIEVYTWFDDEVGRPLDLSGTGVLQAVQILAYVCLYRPDILILDEPDSHLHPYNQRLLVQLLDELSVELGFQILMTTHSRQILDEATSMDANIIWLSGGQIESENAGLVSRLGDLGALDTIDRLGGREFELVILTEDRKGNKFLSPIMEANGWKKGQYEIVPYEGTGNIGGVIALLRFLRDRFPDIKIVVYRDRDYDDKPVEELREKTEGQGAFFFTSPGVDIESFYLQESHLSEVAPTGIDWETLLSDLYEDSRAAAKDKFINSTWDAGLYRDESSGPAIYSGKADRLVTQDPGRWHHGKAAFKSGRKLYQENRQKYSDASNTIATFDEWALSASSALVIEGFPER